ncbi:unnamed protein product [Candidula unifasciata]|uniref:Molybdenum cofactor sulfurase n=1 Tax=Candidula unifasciata TaxID=100452 RepID=A0A8S3ZSF3_9EUPU|nr:unnamed protein product [Candidula unifasciata]
MATPNLYNFSIEQRRQEEFPQLRNAVYVDHAGATLCSKSQIDAVHQELTSTLYGNPHSYNASSKLATDTVDQIRYRLLKFFNTSHEEYSLIFTAGCTASLKIVAECFSFGNEPSGVFCFLEDNHTSVQGMRELVAERSSGIFCLNEEELTTAISNQISGTKAENENLPKDNKASSPVDPPSVSSSARSLLAYPAQSNFSGRKYPLDWVNRVQKSGLGLPGRRQLTSEKWFVLLDAAAFVSTSRLNLSEVKPDFVTLSFYKMFGYPTGLGALLVHKRASNTLSKKYFGGGTVAMSAAKDRFHVFRDTLHERFEDGTLPFLSIISLRLGLDALNKLAGGMDRISQHVFAVAQYFHHHLQSLKHGNGHPLAQIYGDVQFNDPREQGGLVTFNLRRADGKFIGFAEVDKFAQLHDVHLRTGCFCNIGACQIYLNLSSKLIRDNFAAGHVCGDNMDLINGLPTGAVRISFGYMSTISDARVCLRFIADTFLEQVTPVPIFPDPEWYRSASEDGKSDLTEVKKAEKVTKALEKNVTVTENGVTNGENKDVNTADVSAASVSKTCSETVRKVTDIFLYPIKSCGAFRVSEWAMSSKGLLYDREWVLVSDTGVTIGQKREPRICLLSPFIDLERRKLVLSFPGASPFELPLDQEDEDDATASLCTNKVCGDRVNTVDCGEAVSDWLSNNFETSGIRMLRQQSDDTRQSKLKDKENIGSTELDKPKLSMANESQLVLLSRASVRELQKKMVEIIDVNDTEDTNVSTAPADISEDKLVLRFRGNLVIDGGKSFEEEEWSSIQVGQNTVVCQGACSRCQMICMDQETGQKSREPLRTLGVWRGKKVPFGVHARMLPPTDGSRQFLRVGDIVLVKQ